MIQETRNYSKYNEEEGKFIKRFLIQKDYWLDNTLTLPPKDCNEFWANIGSNVSNAVIYYIELLRVVYEMLKKGYSKNVLRLRQSINTLFCISHYIRYPFLMQTRRTRD